MKVVFLTLLLGLVCAAQEEEAKQSASELSGHWSTAYIASNNLEKSTQKNLLIRFRCYIVFCNNCLIKFFYVYDTVHHVWKLLYIWAIPIGPYIYTYKHNGTNQIEFIPISEKALVAINVNVDETGKKTEHVVLFGKENDIDKEDLQKFKDVSLSRGIPEENIKDLTKADECVSLA